MPDPAFLWLRPLWLWGLLPLLLAVLWWWRQGRETSAWESVVEPALQPYVIEQGNVRRRWSVMVMFSGWLLTILVLAGPVWQQQDIPVFEATQSQVLLFDLSASMQVDDIKPSRLVRARYKLTDLLAQADGVQLALVAFSERPYVISPLTDDAATVAAFVPSLTPDIMPVQGSRADLAIERGVELLAQANATQGHLVLVTDTAVGSREIDAATRARDAGHRLSVLAVGTAAGAPLRGPDGRFLQDENGGIAVPQIDREGLANLARAGGGVMVALRSDASDLQALQQVQSRLQIRMANTDQNGGGENLKRYWIEWGPWALGLIAFFALGFFRRGVIW